MSLLEVALVASAGIYAYVAFHALLLYAIRPVNREHGAFALLSACLAQVATGVAVAVRAQDVAEAAAAQNAVYLSGMVSCGAFVSFCSRMTPTPAVTLERGAWTFAGLATAACAAGLFVDPAFPSATYDGSLPLAGGRPAAALEPVGVLAFVGCLAFALAGIVHLGRAARRHQALRGPFVAVCLPFAAGAWDVASRTLHLDLPHLSSFVAIVAIGAISYALVGRLTRIEAELAARTEELARSYDALRDAQRELVRTEQLAAIGELSAVIAHEVRNPLAIIRNAVSGLRRAQLRPTDAETLLGILDQEADRLNRLVDNLLAYARPVRPEPRPVDVVELVSRAVDLARQAQSQRRNVTFELNARPDVGSIEADPALVRQALINIVDNAIEAMPDGGTVWIDCRATDLGGRPAVAISFHDEGEGMDTLVRSKARDPFFTTRQSGTGLGLAIVDRVARVHGGRLDIESRSGSGTTVTLVLPRATASTP